MITIPLVVHLDGGAELRVVADQRDYAAAEAQGVYGTLHTRLRFIGFNALKRTGQYSGSWERFNTVECIEVSDIPEQAEGDDGLDPGRPDTSAGA